MYFFAYVIHEIFWWLLLPLSLPLELLGWCVDMFFGGAPHPQTWTLLRHKLKRLCGFTVVSTEIDGRNGYLYWKYTYSDGSYLLFR